MVGGPLIINFQENYVLAEILSNISVSIIITESHGAVYMHDYPSRVDTSH